MDLRKYIGLGANHLLGVDIGSAAVKVVALRRRGDRYAVTAAVSARIDNAASTEAAYRAAARALQDALRNTNVKTRCAVCGVSGPEVAVRDFRFPALPEDEIEGAVNLEARQVCPFNVDNSAVDYQILNNQRERNTGIIAAATSAAIRARLDITRIASLRCVLMDVDGLALLNACRNTADSHDAPLTAVLNIGAATTTLAVAAPNGLPFIRDMTCAANAIISRIAETHDTTASRVEKCLAADPAGAPFDILQALEAASAPLLADIAKSLRYYAAQEDSRPIERILACGGFTLVPGFVEMLDRRLGPAVERWNPFDNMQCDADEATRETVAQNGPVFAVAAGLAMRTV